MYRKKENETEYLIRGIDKNDWNDFKNKCAFNSLSNVFRVFISEVNHDKIKISENTWWNSIPSFTYPDKNKEKKLSRTKSKKSR